AMQAMDLMQYQDIHRQKIERVINVMRALAQYMNSLFEGKIDDSKRVSSAVFIAGDDKEDVVNEDDIEAMIASFGAK
ncbi:MAG: chemotaxis protein, partial [Helicobacter japonicus]|nr:chemotaxis protein [Helicobacter japonicus]